MKYDTALIAERVPGDQELARAMGIDSGEPLFVAGSTGPGEEEMLLGAYAELRTEFPRLRLAIIPRKPERFAEVARLIEGSGYGCRRRSAHPGEANAEAAVATSPQTDDHPVILGDTMGELRKFYALADLVFVGRSLVPMGGSDMIEVAALARPMCFGPHTQNFSDVAEALLAAKAAVQLGDQGDLVRVVGESLRDRDAALDMGRRAQDVVRQNRGATQRTVDLLCASLGVGATADNR